MSGGEVSQGEIYGIYYMTSNEKQSWVPPTP